MAGVAFTFSFNYTGGECRKISEEFPGDQSVNAQLPFVPEEMENAAITFTKRRIVNHINQISGFIGINHSGFRYIDESNTQFLSSFSTVNLGINAEFGMESIIAQPGLEIDNLFNENYQVMLAYPMPLQYMAFHLKVHYLL